MEFRLLYAGRLPGSSSNKNPEAKHVIRREFHPQLRQLWKSDHNLDEWARRQVTAKEVDEINTASKVGTGKKWDEHTNEDIRHLGLKTLSEKWVRCGYKFVPLVTEEMFLRCSLDIMLLRPEEPHMIMTSGDLDSRVKTIFDALRIPTNAGETAGQGPLDDETPFYCLLSDAKLISSISVTTGKLLTLPEERQVHQHDAFVVVHVKLQPTPRKWDFGYLFE